MFVLRTRCTALPQLSISFLCSNLFQRTGQREIGMSVGFSFNPIFSSHFSPSGHCRFGGCWHERSGDARKRYFPASTVPISKYPFSSVVVTFTVVCLR